MNAHWQDEMLALVTQYGEQCAQLAGERERGVSGHPPADRATAWRAILAHLAASRQQPVAELAASPGQASR